MFDTIYLDHNALSPMPDAVMEAMVDAIRTFPANPSSTHRQGRAARERLDAARDHVGEMLGARTDGDASDCVLFTSGGVEANNLAIFGIADTLVEASHLRMITSGIEHASVVRPAEYLMEVGWHVDLIGADADGRWRTEQLKAWTNDETDLAALILANHETGVIQPIAEAVEICRRHEVLLHTDASQAVGKVPVSFRDLGVDSLAFSAQKFGGPVGVGGLILRSDIPFQPLMVAGDQQYGMRPGTESVPLAVGLEMALELRLAGLQEYDTRMRTLREHFEGRLKIERPEIVVNGQAVDRIGNTSSISFVGQESKRLHAALDAVGVACSQASACEAETTEVSSTLESMDVPKAVAASAIRFSFGPETTVAMVDDAVARIVTVLRETG